MSSNVINCMPSAATKNRAVIPIRAGVTAFESSWLTTAAIQMLRLPTASSARPTIAGPRRPAARTRSRGAPAAALGLVTDARVRGWPFLADEGPPLGAFRCHPTGRKRGAPRSAIWSFFSEDRPLQPVQHEIDDDAGHRDIHP